MTSWVLLTTTALIAGLLAGGATWWTMRLHAERDLAAVGTERDLLRERIVDLEATVSEDAQTAAVLAPLGETIARVERQVGVLERDRTSQFADLSATIRHVHTATGELGRATQSLAGSLQSANVRGAWGEVQLRRVLEDAGMLARCDFDTQVSAVSRHGAALRPDAVVRLPGDKVLVIDAKAPMQAFLRAQAEDLDPQARSRLLGEHARALTDHVGALSDKEYWTAFETTPEMVVCFVPSEGMLATALAVDPSLHESALRSKVVLASPGSLFALVRTVAFTWQQDALSANARELLTLGRELYARLGTLGRHVTDMGGSLSRSIEAYNRLVGTLETRVLVTARRFRELDLVTEDLAVVEPVGATPRLLTAIELLEAVASEDGRLELLLDDAAGDAGSDGPTRSGREVS